MTIRWLYAPVAAIAVLASLAAPALSMPAYAWKKRPLLVFAPSEGHSSLAAQRRTVDALRPAFQDRQIVVVYVVGETVTSELGPGPGLSAEALRARFGVAAASFRAVLVGKDGGVKLSSSAPIAATTLFSTIDAMPMRRQEMKAR